MSPTPPHFGSSSLSLSFSLHVQFAGFSSESLCERIMDAQSSVLVTAGRSSLSFGRAVWRDSGTRTQFAEALRGCKNDQAVRGLCSNTSSLLVDASHHLFAPPPFFYNIQMVFTEERSWSTWNRLWMRLWRSAGKSRSHSKANGFPNLSNHPCLRSLLLVMGLNPWHMSHWTHKHTPSKAVVREVEETQRLVSTLRGCWATWSARVHQGSPNTLSPVATWAEAGC